MKVMNDDGFGSSANHMPALEYILENKANNPGKRYIVNMSLSTGQTVSEDIADTLAAHNILLIASAGNTPSSYWTNSNDCFYKVTYPAAVASYSDNVISVSASDHKDFPVYNTRCANQIGEITVMAPAGAGGGPEYCNFDCAAITTSPIQHSANQIHTNTDYYRFAGNSSGAAAHVSGVAALVWSVNTNLTPSEIKQIIINSADKVPGMNGQNYHNRYGYGRVNAVRAVHLARRPMILELAQQRKSVDIDATGSNQGRRAVHDGSKLHIVFESDGEIFYYQRLSSGAFTDPVFLSDVQPTLIGHNGNPSIALVSGSIHVTWSKKRYGFHDYVVMHKYSSNGGATWSPDEVVVQGLEQDSDPIPVLSSSVVSWSPHLLLTYKGSDGLYALSWNTSTKEFGPYSGSSTKIPYTNNTHTSPAVAGSYYGSVTRHHAVTSAKGASIFYSMFTPSTGAWTIPVNLSSIVPGSASHLTPSISGDINGNVHLVWHRSTGSGQYQNVIYHRRKHTSDGTWPNQYWATYYQYQSRPSVRTNGSDAIMLFTAPFSSSNSVFKQNFTTWPSAGWSSPSLVSGNAQNASITLNGTSMGVWTAGSGNPFSVSTSSGTLSKESLGKPLEYIRSLSWIDGIGWGEIRFMEPQLEVDGRKIAVPWVAIHPDTTITMDNLSLFFRPDLTGLSSIELEEGSLVFGVEYLAGEEIGNDNTKLVFEVEGNAIYKQPMSKTGLRTYRLSTGAVSNDTPVRIALENVPEPATLVVGHLMSGKEGEATGWPMRQKISF